MRRMTAPRRNKILLALALLVVAFVGWRILHAGRISREARQNFEWFSTLGFPDIKDCPYVRATTGTETMRDGELGPEYELGFLLNSNTNTFTILTLDLQTKSYVKSSNGTPAPESVGFEP